MANSWGAENERVCVYLDLEEWKQQQQWPKPPPPAAAMHTEQKVATDAVGGDNAVKCNSVFVHPFTRSSSSSSFTRKRRPYYGLTQ